MQAVQADLTQWLPKTVDTLVAKIKGGAPAEDKADANNGEMKAEPKKDEQEKEAGEKS
jgi:hypothetical protein